MYKHYFENKQAVIFDLDGTLVDTHPIWKVAYETVLKTLGVIGINYDDFKYNGADVYSLWDYILSNKSFDVQTQFKISELAAFTNTEFIKYLATLPTLEPTEGFWEFAFELKSESKNQKRFKLALSTNTDKAVAQQILAKLNISQTFDVYTFGDEVKRRKPNAEMYKLTAQKLGIPVQNLLAFEDSVAGTQAAVAAGIETFVVWPGDIRKSLYPNEVAMFVRDFTSFPGYIDKTYEYLLTKS